MMPVTLTITFDGDVPGLRENRLSLAAFEPALAELVKAYRRTASNLIASADSATGRLSKDSELLDLELAAIHTGSACPVFVATQATPTPQQLLFPDLARAAADRLLQDIDAESSGRLQSSVARAYLAALPTGLRRQEYVLRDGDTVVRTVAFGEARIAALPTKLPRLVRTTGPITGAGFPPGESYVELLADGKVLLCSATPEQVDTALSFRGRRVQIAAVGVERLRLIWIRLADDPFKALSPEERLKRINADWADALTALAK